MSDANACFKGEWKEYMLQTTILGMNVKKETYWSPFFIFQQRSFVSRSNLNSGYSCIKIVVKKDKKKAPHQSWKNLDFKGLFNSIGAREGTRTPMVARQILSLVRLPISPHAHCKLLNYYNTILIKFKYLIKKTYFSLSIFYFLL